MQISNVKINYNKGLRILFTFNTSNIAFVPTTYSTALKFNYSNQPVVRDVYKYQLTRKIK